MNEWVYRGQVKRLVWDEQSKRYVAQIVGKAEGYWRLFQHGRAA